MELDITISKGAKIQTAPYESVDINVSMTLKDVDSKEASKKLEILSQIVSKQMITEQAISMVDYSVIKKPNFIETFKQLADKFSNKISELFAKLGE